MMKLIKLVIFIYLIIPSIELIAQSPERVEMADTLRQDGKIYTVVVGLVIILTSMIVLLVRLDKKIFKIESQEKKGQE